MSSEFTFIRVYKDLANQRVQEKDVINLYWSLQDKVGDQPEFSKWFEKSMPDHLGALLAIDAVAHAIHQGSNEVLQKVFPGAEYSIMKETLDGLAGLEKNNEIRKFNRGYFTTLLTKDGIVLLEKQDTQVGMTTKEEILPAIREYERLYKAGFASPAEILTLSRFYPDNPQYRKAVEDLQLFEEENEPMVIGGPASVEAIDKEGHLITTEALDNAFQKFMSNFRERNLNILHSDVSVGWVLPAYITKGNRIFKSGVDDRQLWVIGELRNDTKISKRVAEEIKNGNLRSYSIAGSATETAQMQKGMNKFLQVNALEMAEITLCLVENSKVWTREGLKNIENIQIGEFVYTHQSRWRKVINKMSRAIDEEIIFLTTDEKKELKLTNDHPIRKIVYGGQNIGTHYDWIEAEKLQVGDLISTHKETGKCSFCNTSLFKKIEISQRNFCSRTCRYGAIGNRSGSTYISKLKGITKKENPNLSGGIKTLEGKAIQRASVTSNEFRKKRSIGQKEKCKDPDYIKNVCVKGGKAAVQKRLNALGEEGYKQFMKRMWKNSHYRRGQTSSQEEIWLTKFLDEYFPGQWRFVGDWQFLVGTKCPDFWNGDHKLIELFGNFWHRREDESKRIDFFKENGYKCLVVWTHEIRNPDILKSKIEEFSNNSWSKIISIEKIPYQGMVYNLEVEEDNSYTTEACVVHNCAKGINSGAAFDILKSLSMNETPSLEVILDSFSDDSLVMPGFSVTIEKSDNPKVVIKADKSNSLTDTLILELQKRLPVGTSVVVYDNDLDVTEQIPVYKMQLTPLWKDAEQGTPPRPGLVPKSGNPRMPYRWIKPETNNAEIENKSFISRQSILNISNFVPEDSDMANRIISSLVRTKIPLSHIKDASIILQYDLPKMKNKFGVDISPAGLYEFETGIISYSFWTFLMGRSVSGLIHEIGHHVWEIKVSQSQKKIVKLLYQRSKKTGNGFVSNYAKSNINEYFAESYRAYIRDPKKFGIKNAPLAKIIRSL